MAKAIVATYENGVLKPAERLPLSEHERVLVVVVPLAPDAARVARMREQVENWLSQQPADAVREPLTLSPETEQRLDDEFDAALAAIRARASRVSEGQILADVESAIAEVRSMSDEERAHLDAELNPVHPYYIPSTSQ